MLYQSTCISSTDSHLKNKREEVVEVEVMGELTEFQLNDGIFIQSAWHTDTVSTITILSYHYVYVTTCIYLYLTLISAVSIQLI